MTPPPKTTSQDEILDATLPNSTSSMSLLTNIIHPTSQPRPFQALDTITPAPTPPVPTSNHSSPYHSTSYHSTWSDLLLSPQPPITPAPTTPPGVIYYCRPNHSSSIHINTLLQLLSFSTINTCSHHSRSYDSSSDHPSPNNSSSNHSNSISTNTRSTSGFRFQ
jgi:hypothetical protein